MKSKVEAQNKHYCPRVECVQVEHGFFDLKITPKAESIPDWAKFEFFYSDQYLPDRDVSSAATRLGVANSMVHSGLKAGSFYYYWVRTVNGASVGPLYSLTAPTKKFKFSEAKITNDCLITGNLDSAVMQAIDDHRVTPHEEAKAIMEAKKAEIRSEASPLVGGTVGEVSSLLSAYERPAIVITDRAGDIECTMEFATAADYKAWKELE